MNKNVVLILFMILSFPTFAQRYAGDYDGGYGFGSRIRMGFRFAPTIISNYVEAGRRFNGFDSGGLDMRVSLGPTADFFFAEKYAFSTGLLYTVKSVHYSVPSRFYNDEIFSASPVPKAEQSGDASYNLQYLQVPLTLKLYTDELFDRTKMYIQCGGMVDIKVAEKPLEKYTNAIYQFQQRLPSNQNVFGFGDANLVLGLGLEYNLGRGMDAVFFGIQYQRGLVEINNQRAFDDLITKNNIIQLEMGVRF